jgi:cell division protein FtsI/penicillin-binding protein 2
MSQRNIRATASQETESASAGMPVRLAFMCALFAGCVLVLVWRLYTFQIRDVERYQRLASEERRTEIPIIPRRGALLDTNGNPLSVKIGRAHV